MAETPTTPGSRKDRSAALAGVGVSLVVHAMLLALLGAVTWAVIAPEPPRDVVITLGEAASAFDATGESGGSSPESGASEASPAKGEPVASSTPPVLPLDAATLADAFDDAGAFSELDPALATLQLPTGGDAAGGGSGLLGGTSGDFQGAARGLGRRGVDVVLVIDATNSMAPFAAEARDRLHDVVAVLTGILRDAGGRNDPRLIRFGVVAFKDYGDDFGLDATKSLPLTSDTDAVRAFIDALPIGGGGDREEPTHRALQVAADPRTMGWRRDRAAIILLVSDAPVHLTGRDSAPAAAAQFAQRMRGTVSVIDVGGEGEQDAPRTAVLPDFTRIARAGNGSAFLLTDRGRFWTFLLTSVFGERYAQDIDLIVEKYAASRTP